MVANWYAELNLFCFATFPPMSDQGACWMIFEEKSSLGDGTKVHSTPSAVARGDRLWRKLSNQTYRQKNPKMLSVTRY